MPGLLSRHNVANAASAGGIKTKLGRGQYIVSLGRFVESESGAQKTPVVMVKMTIEEVLLEYEAETFTHSKRDFEYKVPGSNLVGEAPAFPILFNFPDQAAGIIAKIIRDIERICGEDEPDQARMNQYLEDPDWYEENREGVYLVATVDFKPPGKPGKSPWPRITFSALPEGDDEDEDEDEGEDTE